MVSPTGNILSFIWNICFSVWIEYVAQAFAINQIKQFLGEDYIRLADWMSSELDNSFEGYNEVYRGIMRTDINKVENYFPVQYNKSDINNDVDVQDVNLTFPSPVSCPQFPQRCVWLLQVFLTDVRFHGQLFAVEFGAGFVPKRNKKVKKALTSF